MAELKRNEAIDEVYRIRNLLRDEHGFENKRVREGQAYLESPNGVFVTITPDQYGSDYLGFRVKVKVGTGMKSIRKNHGDLSHILTMVNEYAERRERYQAKAKELSERRARVRNEMGPGIKMGYGGAVHEDRSGKILFTVTVDEDNAADARDIILYLHENYPGVLPNGMVDKEKLNDG